MTAGGGLEVGSRTAEPSLPILEVAGELDLNTCRELDRRTERALRGPVRSLTVDLRDLTFMDSTGVRLLIELNARARREGWSLVLVPSRHDSARTALRFTGADTVLPFAAPGPP